jgi:glycosyltransferase involved in cell wall biosynthesis
LKVLFIRSGNHGIDPITQNQGESLISNGVFVFFYDILGHGIMGYFRNIVLLRKKIKECDPDILHAHYSISGILTSLCLSGKPIIVSLMGSDVMSAKIGSRLVIWIFSHFVWNLVIVKSEEMRRKLGNKVVHVIPNGVNLEMFSLYDKCLARKKIEWDENDIIILFGSDPSREEKNYSLFEAAFSIGKYDSRKVKIKHLVDVKRELVYLYLNAADVLVLTSKHEGSPNVIKEAMACNCPVVATDVGDVREIICDTEGCYISSFDPEDVNRKINAALAFRKRTQGREKILHLDSKIIAMRITKLYNQVLLKSK